MSNQDPVGRQSPMHLPMLALFGVFVAVSVVGCTMDPVEPIVMTPGPVPTVPTLGEEVVGVCVDTSGSVMRALAQEAVEAVAASVEDWGHQSLSDRGGLDPVAPLVLEVRKVLDDSSLHPAGEVASGRLPSVPGAMPKPDLASVGDVSLIREHRRQVDQSRDALEVLRPEALALAAQIRQGDWSSPKGSEIWGCLEALALTTPPVAQRRFLLVSDLLQNDPRQAGLARFESARVWIVHQCSEAKACAEAEGEWSDTLRERGAGEVIFIRPERLEVAVAQWLRGS